MKAKIQILFFFLLMALAIPTYSQVGINTETPDEKAILDIVNSEKGILIPRMTEAQRDLINPTANQQSLLIFNTDEDCFNFWHKTDNEWKSLCGETGKATFEISDCNSISTNGLYRNQEALGTSHYITVTVKVTKAGTYIIKALPDPKNGYYFTLSGEFLATGDYQLIIPGAGTPTNFTPAGGLGDLIKFNLNGVVSNCTTRIIIGDSSVKPLYKMDCSKTVVNGVYVVDKPLNPSTNTITMVLTVAPTAIGAQYVIETNEVEGIRFYGSGILIGGKQTVTLKGEGTPTSIDTKRMTIKSNSASSVATCSAFVPVSFTKKRIMTFGSTAYYGYNLGLNIHPAYTGIYAFGGRKILDSNVNFGQEENSTIKVDGFEYMNMNMTLDQNLIQSRINSFKPDIIVLAYSYAPTTACVDVFIKYMEKKGVVIAFLEDANSVRRLFTRTLNISGLSALSVGTAGDVYSFNYMAGDKILDGPFGDVREKFWGEDASTTIGVTGVPRGMVDVYSTASRYPFTGGALSSSKQDCITACKFKQHNLIWIGDGGFYSRGITAAEVNSRTICPLYYDADFRPIEGPFGNAAAGRQVANAIFFANVMAWAVKQAETDGYNTSR